MIGFAVHLIGALGDAVPHQLQFLPDVLPQLAGIDARFRHFHGVIGFRLDRVETFVDQFLRIGPRAIGRFLDKLGLEASQIDGSYPMMGPNGSAFGVQYVQQTIRFAAELDCPMVDTVDGAFEIPGLSRKEVFRVTCDNYRQVLSWAEDYKVVVNVEPHGPYTNDIDFMQRLFAHFESEWLRCNFDTGNTFIAGHNPLDYCKALRKYISHCHIKDVSPALAAAVRGEETGIGSSEVFVGGGVNADNIRACMEYLHGTGWDGVVSLECSGTDENTRRSVAWMQGVVKGLKGKAKRK